MALFSASLAAFTLTMMSLDASEVASSIRRESPVRFVAGFLIDARGLSSLEKRLVGMWHSSPSLAAGWGERYFFFSDRTFRFEYSQFDEAKRTIDISGTWSIDKDGLVLMVRQETVVVGGQLEKASPSATSEYSIVGGNVEKKQVDPARKVVHVLGKIERDESHPNPVMVKIDGQQFWKYTDDPAS